MPQHKFSYANLGLSLALGFFLCVFGGYWLGKKFDKEAIGLMVGFFLGLAYWVYELSKVFKKMDEDK